MRSVNSIKNTVVAIVSNLIAVVIGFVAQKAFLQTLGLEYAGLNGLFNNIVSMLAIAELGIGTAIVYHLYKPIAEKDIPRIQTLMKFYKISYRVIAGMVLVLGMLVLPFLQMIVGEISVPESMYAMYALFLADTAISYLLTYKRSILYANEKNYIVNVVHIGYLFIMNGLQIATLYLFQNIFVFLGIKVVCRFLENVVITIIANKKYTYLKQKEVQPIDEKTKKDIFTKIKGLIFHKIGGFLVLGSDNIIISVLFGVKTVGLYTNYSMIVTAIENLVSQVFSSITASIGNLLVEKNAEKSYQTYRKLLFFNFVFITFCTIAFFQLVGPFITILYGAEYVLPIVVALCIAVKFYFQNMRKNMNAFKEAAGVFYEDRYIPLVEVLVNIVVSIILGKLIGLAGVFIGTAISSLVLYGYSYPKYVYEPLFKRKNIQYWKENAYYLGMMAILFVITEISVMWIPIANVWMAFFVRIVATILVPSIGIWVVFRKKEEFLYFKGLVQKMVKTKR